MKTQLDIALERSTGHPVPPITHPYGAHWRQPNRFTIEIDATHALMTRATMDMLAEYSCSIPTGVYEGKMWKALSKGVWYLAWYGPCDKPDQCSINYREILLV